MERKPEYLLETYDTENPEFISIFDELPLWSAPFGRVLLDTVKLKKNINALDIGFGTGFPMIEIAQRVGQSSKVFGLDLNEAMYDRVDLKLKQCKIRNVHIKYGSAESQPFENDFFDLIVSNNGINNVSNQDKAMNECFRTLKKDGQMVLTMNLPDTMKPFYNVFEKVLQSLGKLKEIEKMKEHIRSKRKSDEENKVMIKNAGFQIAEIKLDEFFLRYVDGSTFLNHFLITFAFLPSWRDILDKSDVPLVFPVLENELNKLTEAKGELKLPIPFACYDCIK